MKVILPGAAIGLLGGGENSRMFALAGERMGYRVHAFPTESAGDLDRIRKFAAEVDVVTVVSGDVSVIALQAAAGSGTLYPPMKTFEAVENGVGTKRDFSKAVFADFSIIGARGINGECVFYDPIAIDRVDGVLDIARSPAPIGSKLARKAINLTRDVLEDLDVTGIACVEFTLSESYELTIHDVTPHPHSSGNVTADSCVTSQFEQQLRAICGLPFGSTQMLSPTAMAVLPAAGESDWVAALTLPEVKLHLGGRYLTATAPSGTRAKQIVRAARASLSAK